MSIQTYTTTGMGFDANRMPFFKFNNFCKNHLDAVKQLGLAKDLKVALAEGWCKEDIEDLTNLHTLTEIVAEVMKIETGIEFEAAVGDEGEEAILFVPWYPWDYNEVERSLTADQLIKIMSDYASEIMSEKPFVGITTVHWSC